MVLRMTIGEKLKEAREAQNLTLDDIQETTKIQKRYLRAIEEGNFHILPGSFYARAFIKEYAQALNLDDELLLETHKDELPAIGERRSEAQYTRIQRTRKSSGPSRASAILSFLPTLIVILLVVIIIGLAIYFMQQKSFVPENENHINNSEFNEFYRKENDINASNNEEINNDEDENENNIEEELEEIEEEEKAEFSVLETNENMSPPVSVYQFTSNEESLTLNFQTDNESWLGVVVDGENIFNELFTENDSPLEFDITDKEEISLNVGYAIDLKIAINDTELTYEIDEKDHVHQRIVIQLTEEE